MVKLNHSLRIKFILMSICPVLVFGIVFLFIGLSTIRKSGEKEILNSLNGICNQLRQDFTSKYPGNYSAVKGNYFAGNTNIHNENAMLDKYKENFNAEVTIFYGSSRALTTIRDTKGNRIISTSQLDENVLATVFSGGTYTSGGVMINDEEYYVAYIPLYDNDKVFGMVFAGLTNANFKKLQKTFYNQLILVILILCGISSIVISLVSKKYADTITSIKNYLGLLVKKQDAFSRMPEEVLDRKDEIGDLARYAQEAGNQLTKMISIDPLTGLYNRRAGNQLIEESYMLAEQDKASFTVVMCDIDDFKKINDTYGHKTGDEVLVRISDVLLNTVHTFKNSYAIRWGGEEFLIGFQMPLERAKEIIRSVSLQIRALSFTADDNTFSLTLTYGLAEYSKDKDADALINHADKNMYKGKYSGKNQIICE